MWLICISSQGKGLLYNWLRLYYNILILYYIWTHFYVEKSFKINPKRTKFLYVKKFLTPHGYLSLIVREKFNRFPLDSVPFLFRNPLLYFCFRAENSDSSPYLIFLMINTYRKSSYWLSRSPHYNSVRVYFVWWKAQRVAPKTPFIKLLSKKSFFTCIFNIKRNLDEKIKDEE